ncbi:MAG: hypothetical protein O3B95_01690 [Chloroflexi bacterium]|nr:hypothetical protein [Chloroflexota bacterium]
MRSTSVLPPAITVSPAVHLEDELVELVGCPLSRLKFGPRLPVDHLARIGKVGDYRVRTVRRDRSHKIGRRYPIAVPDQLGDGR